MAESTASEFIIEDWMGESPGGRVYLKGQHCARCHVHLWPPVARCKACGSAELVSVELGPEAELHAVTVDRTGLLLGRPYLVGQARFPQGPFVQGFVAGDVDDPPPIGATVELVPFELDSGGERLTTYAFQAREG
jgi:uncharacterized OB-fold protein